MLKRTVIVAALSVLAFTQNSFAQFDFRTVNAPRFEIRGTSGYPVTTCASNWGCMAYDFSQQAFVCSKNGGAWGPCTFGAVGGGGGVTAFNGRTGLVIPQAGDYIGSIIAITAPGSGITGTDVQTALNQLAARPSGVSSFNGRTGAVIPVTADYSVAMVTGAAPIASPSFTGAPLAPTPTAGDNTTRIATTAFVNTAIGGSSGCGATCVNTTSYQVIGAPKNFSAQVGQGPGLGILTVQRPANAAGTVTVTAATNTITGTTTNFATFLMIGEPITLSNGEQRDIATIVSDTSATVTSNWTNSCTGCTYTTTIATTLPLLVRNNYFSTAVPFALTGAFGNGNIFFSAQGIAPPAPSDGFKLYADVLGKLTWRRADGWTRKITDSNTANHEYALQNQDGTFALINAPQTFSSINIFSVAQQFAAGSAAAPGIAVGTPGLGTTGLYSPGTSQFGITTAGVSAVQIDASQHVGINGAPLATNLTVGPGGVNSLLGNITVNAGSTGTASFSLARNGVTAGQLVIPQSAGVVMPGDFAGDLDITNGQAMNWTTDAGVSRAMRLTNSGLGIGKAPANGKIDVKGVAWIEDTATDHAVRITPGTTGGSHLIESQKGSAGTLLSLRVSANAASFPNQVYLDSGGSGGVGIGGAPATNVEFDVNGSGNIDSEVRTTGTTQSAAFVASAGNGTTSSRSAYTQYLANETTRQLWLAGMFGTKDYVVHDVDLNYDALLLQSAGGPVFGRYLPAGTVTSLQSASQMGLVGLATFANGSGPRQLFYAGNSAGTKSFMGSIGTDWLNVTAGSERAELIGTVRANTGDVSATTVAFRATDTAFSAVAAFNERGRTLNIGEWTAFTPALTNFSACGTTTAKYMLVGKSMTVALFLTACTVSGTPTSVSVTIPGGFTSAGNVATAFPFSDNGTPGTGYCQSNGAAGTLIQMYKDINATGTWGNSTTNTKVACTLTFEIQ